MNDFLPDDFDTPRMSTNVGTEKFKAPEMFLRNEKKKLVYHRNVDIYSTGLTYLAMLQESKPLLPRPETPQDDSEIHYPTGSTSATRIRRRKRPLTLDVVAVDKEKGFLSGAINRLRRSFTSLENQEASHQGELRKLIQKMTAAQPKDRPSVTSVLPELKKVSTG